MKRGFLLTVLLICTHRIYADEPKTFSMRDSALLFGADARLWVATPDSKEAIKPPVEVTYNRGYFLEPSLSPHGDFVAWGFATEVRQDRKDHAARFALGVFRLTEKTWKTFGDFDDIGRISFSQDGSRIQFVAEQQNETHLWILDLTNGAVIKATSPIGIPEGTVLKSWSPDGKRVVVEIHGREKDAKVGVLDVETGKVQIVANGFGPAWSPAGEWIAYFNPSGKECLVVHPDGTGAKTVSRLRQTWLSYKRFGWSSPVWSPDGKQVLVNVMKGDGDYIDVLLLNIQSGEAKKKAKNGIPVYGWASNPRKP